MAPGYATVGQRSLSRGDWNTDQSKLREIEGEQKERSIAVSLLSVILVGDPSFNKFKLFPDKNASIIRPLVSVEALPHWRLYALKSPIMRQGLVS